MKTFSNSKGKIHLVKVIQLLPSLPTLSVHGAEENANESQSRSAVSDPLRPHGLYSLWNSPDQNTGVGSYSLLQGIIPTQGSNPGLLHCSRILYQLRHKGNPRILEWVAYPFSRGSSWPRNWTGVSCISGRFFVSWAIREMQNREQKDRVTMETKTYSWWTRSGTETSGDKLAGLQAYGSRDVTTGVIGSVSSSRVAQTVKNLPAMQETCVQFLGWEDPLEEGMATHSSILPWRIPMDRGTWWTTVHGITESDMTERLSFFLLQGRTEARFHTLLSLSKTYYFSPATLDYHSMGLRHRNATEERKHLTTRKRTKCPLAWWLGLKHPLPTPSRNPQLPLNLILDWGPLREKP